VALLIHWVKGRGKKAGEGITDRGVRKKEIGTLRKGAKNGLEKAWDK